MATEGFINHKKSLFLFHVNIHECHSFVLIDKFYQIYNFISDGSGGCGSHGHPNDCFIGHFCGCVCENGYTGYSCEKSIYICLKYAIYHTFVLNINITIYCAIFLNVWLLRHTRYFFQRKFKLKITVTFIFHTIYVARHKSAMIKKNNHTCLMAYFEDKFIKKKTHTFLAFVDNENIFHYCIDKLKV